ncbi:cation:proton antiporter subunit C [Ehrlichia canis]|uniref:Multisubunit sodium/proton antiporter, MrpC subunit n=1 Tax=Ehrlichia canis (strain Jake) TaxID=269484 RepID=A0ACA6AWK5_EHRCJ|nr:cation:proton antiporter subunit C [Ehrlichia canis]AAZ68591.1 multisubunit sodium/proton antiporter, MrpC subunit [Ehrlichia canis str. Jake]AUO54673.1 cation:proton antiporter [Ehrlichia canis]UKC53787.1 cation:proton antiporter subunit C [Ehrlichia canis]UKC54724.1 cation:proton antiporter subunit C [Ehrlichia canis]UKC55660.1 cation:proton antiporter subunit C [Ehrlichia canis]
MIFGYFNYVVSIILMVIGLYVTAADKNLVKKLIGLNVFQTSVLLFYISIGYVSNGTVPILTDGAILYTNPLPSVLMLTAIVVGVAILAVGLSIIVKIKKAFASIDDEKIRR